jgi:hypothetical protein
MVPVLVQVAELLAGVQAPVVYWEQGHEWIFGDPIRLQVRNHHQLLQAQQVQLPAALSIRLQQQRLL